MRALVWFRSDLRRRDNIALAKACRRATRGVIAVFIICPEQWREHDWADIRVDFILRNLEDLSDALAKLNIPLKIITTTRFKGVPKALLELARAHECDALYFNHEYEVNERRRDEEVVELFAKNDLKAECFHDQVILAPGEVRTKDDGWYSVFTPFKKAWFARYEEIGGVDSRRTPRKPAELSVEPDSIPESVEGFDRSAGRADLWPCGEDHARRRLASFIESRIDDYLERRDAPAVNGTSTLSPYLTSGVISARECLRAAMEANGGELVSGRGKQKGKNGPSHWISELVWREFYKHLIVAHPKLCMGRAFQPKTERLQWRYDEADFEAWCEGRTGYPIVDAAMRQLNQTGWMHNRLRMIVAMFLTKDLFIDWRWGERYFMRRLIDGDLSSNNGGWQWSASTGTDAAPYFRIYNPVTQGQRHDPDAKFIRKFLPELADLAPEMAHEPWKLPEGARGRLDYPKRMCDHAAARERVLAAFKAL